MRILYDHQMFSTQVQGGITRYFSELMKKLPGLGQVVELPLRFTPNRYLLNAYPEKYRELWPSLHFKGKTRLVEFLNRGPARKALKGDDWDLFHPSYYDPYSLSHLKQNPLVITIHDMTHELHPSGLSDARTLPALKKLMAERADAVIAVSENTKRDAVKFLGLPAEKIFVVHHGNSLNPQHVQAKPASVSYPYWLYVGSRGSYKNWKVLVEALSLRSHSGKRDFLAMVGGGPLKPSEIGLLEKAGLAGRYVQRNCTEEELAGWYSNASGLVYTSLYEGFGMPLLEAMAWGCPVICADSSCLPEIAADAALFFCPNDAKGLADDMDVLESDTDFRNLLVQKGLDREKTFTWDSAAKKTLEVYQKALESRA